MPKLTMPQKLKYMEQIKHTHLPTPVRGDILHHRPKHIHRGRIPSKPCHAHYLELVCVWVKQTRQFRLRWSARSDLARAPRGYPSVPLSRCGKAECWMGYPVAPAWLLGSRQLNQSQIGLWTARYEYIFLRLRTQENKSSCECATAIYYYSYYHVDITCTLIPRFRSSENPLFFLSIPTFLSFFHSLSWHFSHPLSLCLSSPSLFLLSSQPSGHRLGFKVLILIWNLLQSVQRWT